jgi:DNA-binding IclR family transcriptional regulator
MKTKAPKASSRYPTPALEKGLDILEMFASEPTGLTKSDVARKLGRTISEIFRMLVCLEERGYIAQSPDSDRYNLTLHLFRLAQEHPPIKRMTMQALPIMQQVAHELSQSCHLGVLNVGQVVIIAQVDSPVSPGFYVKAGAVVDLMHAATGHVILAHQTQEARARAIQTWCKRNKTEAPRDLTSHLAAIRERGYEGKLRGGGSHQCYLSRLGRAWVCGCRVNRSLHPPNWRHHHHGYRAPGVETSEFAAFPRYRRNLARAPEIGHLGPFTSQWLWPIHKSSPQRSSQ